MQLYNSLTRTVEPFVTREPGKVRMYTCGPTVYHYAHIGNLRSYIMEDVLEKFLRWQGFDVLRVMNITDVGHLSSDADTGEDKMLKGARREHKTVMEIAQFYTDAFFADCEKLHIRRPDVVEPATGCIPEFIEMVQKLLDEGYAYLAGGIGEALLQQPRDHLDIIVDAAGRRYDDLRRFDIQLRTIGKESVGIILRDLHHALVLPLCAL